MRGAAPLQALIGEYAGPCRADLAGERLPRCERPPTGGRSALPWQSGHTHRGTPSLRCPAPAAARGGFVPASPTSWLPKEGCQQLWKASAGWSPIQTTAGMHAGYPVQRCLTSTGSTDHKCPMDSCANTSAHKCNTHPHEALHVARSGFACSPSLQGAQLVQVLYQGPGLLQRQAGPAAFVAELGTKHGPAPHQKQHVSPTELLADPVAILLGLCLALQRQDDTSAES